MRRKKNDKTNNNGWGDQEVIQEVREQDEYDKLETVIGAREKWINGWMKSKYKGTGRNCRGLQARLSRGNEV